ncbi:MAG: 50S ribosomal protein L18e [Candidatus Bathyarchaeia archaeon]
MNNPELIKTIKELRRKAKGDAPFWKAIADELDKSKRKRVSINIGVINRHSREGEIIAIPGKVLGSGNLTHPVTVAAFSFSSTARRKIEDVKGRTVKLVDLPEMDPKPSAVRILK